MDLTQPGAAEKVDAQIAAIRDGPGPHGSEGDGLADRPGFRDLPTSPRAEPPDLDSYRSPAELAERKRLTQIETAALPAAPPGLDSRSARPPPPVEHFDPGKPIEGFEELPPAGRSQTTPTRGAADTAARPNRELEGALAARTARQRARDQLDEARLAQQRAEIEEAQRLGRFEDSPGVTGISAPQMRGPNDGLRPHRKLIPGDAEYLDNIMLGRATTPPPLSPPRGEAPRFNVAPERLPRRPGETTEVGPLARSQNQVAAHLVNDYVHKILTEPGFPSSPRGDPIDILLDPAGDYVGTAGHHRLIAAVIASRLTGRPLYGAPNAIIPDNAIVFRNAADSERAGTARSAWRMGVDPPLDDGTGALRARIDTARAAAEDLRRRAAVAAHRGDTGGAARLQRQAEHLDWQARTDGRGLAQGQPRPGAPTPAARPAPSPQSGGTPQRIDRSVERQRYFAADSSNPRFVAIGEVYDLRGELAVQIRTELEDGTRSLVLRGAEEFARIVEFFRGRFTSIKGSWQYGSNLARVNELTGPPHNLSLEDAVTRTWTADQARKAGYPNATNVHGNGRPGQYTEVEASFVK